MAKNHEDNVDKAENFSAAKKRKTLRIEARISENKKLIRERKSEMADQKYR